MSQAEPDTTTTEATVSENKFNGTATLHVEANDERQAKEAARRYFRERHGENASKVVVEVDTGYFVGDDDRHRFTVMVANHSSGSLQSDETYEF